MKSLSKPLAIQLPYNCQILFQEKLTIRVQISSLQQSHQITIYCLLPYGQSQKKLLILFSSPDDLFFLYSLDINKSSIQSLNNEFNLKLNNLNDFLHMFHALIREVKQGTKQALMRFTNQNVLAIDVFNLINAKKFLIISLIAEKAQHQVIQAWTAYSYGQLRDDIFKKEAKITQLKDLIRLKNPYLLKYIDKIQ